jgi:hypothetical protein
MTKGGAIFCTKNIMTQPLYEFDFFGRLRQTNN